MKGLLILLRWPSEPEITPLFAGEISRQATGINMWYSLLLLISTLVMRYEALPQIWDSGHGDCG